MYGNYNLWSYLKYWYLDTSNIVLLNLIDKGYYDYDYERVARQITYEKTVKNEQETLTLLQRFGLGGSVDDMAQKAAMEELGEG